MYSRVRIVAVGLVLSAVGCAMTPRATNTRVNVGTSPEHYEQTIREQLCRTLNDPYA